MPFYGLYHQTGSGAENAGRHRDYRERFAAQKSTGMIGKGEGPHDSLGIGRGNALPRRAFIGLSQEAEAEVIALFEGWFDEATHQIEFYDAPPVSTEPVTSAQFRKLPKEYYVHPGGTVQTRVSGTLPGGKRYGGRFGFGWKPSR